MYEEAIEVLEAEIKELREELAFNELNGSIEVAKGFEINIYRLQSAIKLLQEGKIDYGVNNPNDPTKYGRKGNNE